MTLGWKALLIAVGLVLIGRALSVYPLCFLFIRSRWAVPAREQHVLWWGGLRGRCAGPGVGVAVVDGDAQRNRGGSLSASVAFGALGLTMPVLLRVLGLQPSQPMGGMPPASPT